jgi:hypothetical protein
LQWETDWHEKPDGHLTGAFFLPLEEALQLKGWEQLDEAIFIGANCQVRAVHAHAEIRFSMISEDESSQPNTKTWEASGGKDVFVSGESSTGESASSNILLIQNTDQFPFARKNNVFSKLFESHKAGVQLIQYFRDGRVFDWRLVLGKNQKGGKS